MEALWLKRHAAQLPSWQIEHRHPRPARDKQHQLVWECLGVGAACTGRMSSPYVSVGRNSLHNPVPWMEGGSSLRFTVLWRNLQNEVSLHTLGTRYTALEKQKPNSDTMLYDKAGCGLSSLPYSGSRIFQDVLPCSL